jgi:NAD-dependent dihydropyrimidine dehydrogenase PreA subunit
MFETLTYLLTGLLAFGIPFFYFFKNRKQARTAKEKFRTVIERGLPEPDTLHPKIDPNLCIGAAACVSACPEGEILGVVDGRAALISPTSCIGHGACEAACPVEAISLVFGSERRGVELPYVKKNFETNVPGIYIAGELGGMGLIRNAVTQGREAIDYVRETLASSYPDVFDVAIIGAGSYIYQTGNLATRSRWLEAQANTYLSRRIYANIGYRAFFDDRLKSGRWFVETGLIF